MNGKKIEWKQLWDIFEKISAMSIKSQGLTIAPKLKREHLQLTSYSRMRVDLAAQVRMHTYTPHRPCTHTRVHTHTHTYPCMRTHTIHSFNYISYRF